MRKSASDFYVTQGTLHHDALSYVERAADTDLFHALQQGEFCYVLTSRQMGKSSLMVRTVVRLRAEGVRVAILDLQGLGQNLNAEQWYEGLLGDLGRHLDLEDELDDFWSEHARLAPLQRWMRALREVVLPKLGVQGCRSSGVQEQQNQPSPPEHPNTRTPEHPSHLVIFIDEIDLVQTLPFSADEFFVAIRECFTRRAQDPAFEQLTFCLLGVATPSDLIRDVRTTPFNIGRRIELDDFREEEAASLRVGLELGSAETAGRPTEIARRLLERIFYWTGGHPYLTQRLCRAVAEDPSVTGPAGVDRLCEALFLGARERERDDNLLFVRDRLLRSGEDLASLLELYRQVRAGKRVAVDETNPLVELLRLSGVARATEGRPITPSPLHPFTPSPGLRVRNRIYERVFDGDWVAQHMPDAELRRQRAAYRRGLLRAASVGGAVVALMTVLTLAAVSNAQRARAATDKERLLRMQYQQALRQKDSALAAEARQRELATQTTRVAQAAQQAEQAQRQRAEAARTEALAQSKRAEASADRARTAESAERQERLRGARLLYGADMQLAARAWEEGNAQRTSALLTAHLPRAGDEDRRGFDWRYQWHLLNRGAVTLSGHGGAARLGAFTPSGTLITVDEDLQVRHWDWARRRVTKMVDLAAKGELWDTALSHDGRLLAARTSSGAIQLFDTATGAAKGALRGHAAGAAVRVARMPTSIAFSPDDRRLVSVGRFDRTVRVWDLDTQREVHRIRDLASTLHIWLVRDLALSPDGQTLALAGHPAGQPYVSLFDLDQGVAQQSLQSRLVHGWTVTSVAYSPDGRTLAAGDYGNRLVLWDAATHKEIRRLTPDPGSVSRCCFSPDGRILVTGSQDLRVKLWDVATGKEIRTLAGHTASITFLAFSADGKQLASGDRDGTAKVWELAASAGTRIPPGSGSLVAYSPNGKWLATAARDGTVKLWDTRTGTRLRNLSGQGMSATCLRFSPDGHTLAVGGRDPHSRVKLWNVATGRERPTLEGLPPGRRHPWTRAVGCLAFSPNGRLLVAGFGQQTWIGMEHTAVIKVWDMATSRPIRELKEHQDVIRSVLFSPDGKLMISGSLDRTVKVWKVGSWQVIRNVTGFTHQVTSVALSPDGKVLAIGTSGGSIEFRDLATGRPRFELRGHTNWVNSLAFSPDGKTLASASYDRTARLWDVASRRETRLLTGSPPNVWSLMFSPRGDTLATATTDETVQLWSAGLTPEIRVENATESRVAVSTRLPAPAAYARLRREAYQEIGKQQWPEALRYLDELLRMEPAGWRDRLARVQVLARLKRQREVQTELARVVARHPTDPEPWIERGITYTRLGQWEKAAADFERGLDLAGRDAMMWYRSAMTSAQKGDTESYHRVQMRLLAHAITRKPADPEPRLERGLVYAQLQEWQPAAADFGRATTLQPESPEPWYWRGEAHAELGQWAQAATAFEQAIAHGTGDSWVWYERALALAGAGNTEGCRRACASALARFGQTEEIYPALHLAQSCSLAPNAVSDPLQVVRVIEKAEATAKALSQPDRWFFLATLGLAHYRAGQFAEAIQAARQSLAASPRAERGTTWLLLGMAYSRLDQATEARPWLEKGRPWLAGPNEIWQDRLAFDLLRREAEALMGPKAAGKP